MELSEEQKKILIEVFEDNIDMLSELSRGTLMSEEFELYELLKEKIK